MSTKHTPGPWRTNWTTSIPTIQTLDPNGINHTTLGFLIGDGRRPVDKANGMLIAAAPDLLEALQWLINICTHPKATKADMRMIAREARSAVAKATGNSSSEV